MKNQNGPDTLTNVKLKSIEDFSKDQLNLARQDCPAIDQYLNFIAKPAQNFFEQIRIERHRAWLCAALNTYFSVATTKEICLFWSLQTEKILTKTFNECGLNSEGVALGAFGKLGAYELNLSSDIDLMFVSEKNPSETLLKKIKAFNKYLTEHSEIGFCFRVDYDLRPGGRMGPLVSSAQQLEDYYWGQGETWERMAFTRFHVVCGVDIIKDQLKEFVRRFSFRKFTDMTLFDDLRGLRTKIQSYNFQKTSTEGQINLKLDLGGIRDIELFLHAKAIIHGGKYPELQTNSTDGIYHNLIESRLLKNIDTNLGKAYWSLRDWENKVQIYNDSQTHILKLNSSHFPRVTPEQAQKLKQEMKKNLEVVSSLIGESTVDKPTLAETLEGQKQWLKELGFNELSRNKEWPKLVAISAKSKQQVRDEEIRKNFLYNFINKISANIERRDLALSLLSDFVKSIHAKASFFSLLIREEKLIDHLAKVFTTSPYLSSIIISRPELLDSLLYRAQSEFSSQMEVALDEMAERRLLTEMIGSMQFLSDFDINKLCHSLTDTADLISKTLLKLLENEYGSSQLGVVALGKWGTHEMGLNSDLDFIFVTQDKPTEIDNKIARRFISRLQDEHRGGKIYSVDLRLRPSGNAGPLLVQKSRLQNFLEKEAAPWQRQSYLRSRSLCSFISSKEIKNWSLKKAITEEDKTELKRIKHSLLKQRSSSEIDVKFSFGALVDIEFAIQQRALIGKESHETLNTVESLDQHKELQSIYLHLRTVEQLIKLVSHSQQTTINLSSKTTSIIATAMAMESPNTFFQTLIDRLDRSQQLLKALDPL
jgi:glutamate-ammonia-ligase adenylyltransferase